MEHFEIKSKVYCNPNKTTRALLVLLNLAVIVMAIFSIVSIFMDGIKLSNISGCIVALFVASLFRVKRNVTGHYEFCVLSLAFEGAKLTIAYLPNLGKEVVVDIDSLKSLEYSDKLQCLRIIGNYKEIIKSEVINKEDSELLLYIAFESNSAFYNALEEATGKRLCFVDRGLEDR